MPEVLAAHRLVHARGIGHYLGDLASCDVVAGAEGAVCVA